MKTKLKEIEKSQNPEISNVTKHGGFFIEAGYGKYIISGGLKMSF